MTPRRRAIAIKLRVIRKRRTLCVDRAVGPDQTVRFYLVLDENGLRLEDA